MSFLIENGILKKYTNDDNLTDVIIPDGVIGIDEQAFQSADNIVSVTVPAGVKIIGNLAFCECKNLTTVIFPESIIYIGQGAFSHCRNLTAINTLGKIARINMSTFYFCERLTSITIPESVTYIGENAFSHCGQITSLKLPDSIEVIDDMAFGSCENLADFSIPPKVRKIGYYAFVECKKLSKITLPPTLKQIEEGIFASCKGLTEITIPDSVQIIKNSAFNSCVNLGEVIIPPSVTQIGPFAFSGCQSLRKATIPKYDTEIMHNAFFQCERLTTNFSIKEWDINWGIKKMDYALQYMRNFKAGDPFFEDTKEENKRYIKHQLHNILKMDDPQDPLGQYGINTRDTNVVVFLTKEIPLSIDVMEILLDKVQGNPEASAILLDYQKRNFTEEFLEKYENDKLQRELGLKERTAADWKKIYRLTSDGNDGYMILGYKGKDTIVEIPEKIGKKPVTAIDDKAFSPNMPNITREIRITRANLETVIIPDSVTCIGFGVFDECDNLDNIVYQGKTYTADEFMDYCFSNVPKLIVGK